MRALYVWMDPLLSGTSVATRYGVGRAAAKEELRAAAMAGQLREAAEEELQAKVVAGEHQAAPTVNELRAAAAALAPIWWHICSIRLHRCSPATLQL
ncbi:hypothetical protein C2845_PM08G21930 [Panicum miliaceum]|uniref:Uncharacterized protein n=1 Tax=Panicum miliaceum TaxID=4540 RepID=A0A3L6R706_PANMI|nr:hypothetical protein C2845_PM08G21930 [Panicum miliaceum]